MTSFMDGPQVQFKSDMPISKCHLNLSTSVQISTEALYSSKQFQSGENERKPIWDEFKVWQNDKACLQYVAQYNIIHSTPNFDEKSASLGKLYLVLI